MNSLPRLLAGALLAGLAFATSLHAEVSVQTDGAGVYVRTVIYANASMQHPRIWSTSRNRLGSVPLNPLGDATGDLFPFVAESSTPSRAPWLIWSRFNGSDYDLVWSRWLGTGWAPVAPVEAAVSPDDALEPAQAFGADGRAAAVWLSRGTGRAAVSMSIFLATQWMAPFRVSDPGEDASNPAIEACTNERIQIGYDTPSGHVTRTVVFARPATITDDLTPFGTVTVSDPSAAIVKP